MKKHIPTSTYVILLQRISCTDRVLYSRPHWNMKELVITRYLSSTGNSGNQGPSWVWNSSSGMSGYVDQYFLSNGGGGGSTSNPSNNSSGDQNNTSSGYQMQNDLWERDANGNILAVKTNAEPFIYDVYGDNLIMEEYVIFTEIGTATKVYKAIGVADANGNFVREATADQYANCMGYS